MTREQELTQRVGDGDTSWLAEILEKDKSLDSLQEYRVVPVLRIIQGMSSQELKKEFNEGTSLMMPLRQPLMAADQPLSMVPVFMFTEFRKYSDQSDEDNPMVVDRTFDQQSLLAARSRDAERRSELYEGDEDKKPKDQKYWTYQEVLCFLCVIYEGEHQGALVTVEFRKGSFMDGKNFASACMSRMINGSPVPLWMQIWNIFPTQVNRGGYDYWVHQHRNPDEGSRYIRREEVETFQSWHTGLAEDFEKSLVTVDLSGDEDMDDRGDDL